MKQSDIFTVIIVATVGTVAAAILCNILLGDPNDKSVTFKTVEVIEASLADPDPEVYNPEAVNPTVEVYVGDCVDQDQNGVLDQAELSACGRVDGVEVPTDVQTSESETTNVYANTTNAANDTVETTTVTTVTTTEVVETETEEAEEGAWDVGGE